MYAEFECRLELRFGYVPFVPENNRITKQLTIFEKNGKNIEYFFRKNYRKTEENQKCIRI